MLHGDCIVTRQRIIHHNKAAYRATKTELNCRGLVFDELTNEQAVMHHSRHRLTASLAYVTKLTYTSANDQWARSACPLVSWLRHIKEELLFPF